MIRGFAQKPILTIKASGKIKKHIADRSPTASPNQPMMSGNIAPPIIPVTNIPEIEP
mgnify:CR=1 FL=1